MSKNIFSNVITAVITPFKNGKIDFESFAKIVNIQKQAKIGGIVVAGSTGEGNLLSESEYYELQSAAVEVAAKQIKVISAISSASTRDAAQKAQKLEKIGVDGIMCTLPYYVLPDQGGIYAHCINVCSSVSLPSIIYAHRTRTGVEIEDKTILSLMKCDNILGLKDAGDDMVRPMRLREAGGINNFNFISGNDISFTQYTSAGGSGVISVLSNIFPKLFLEIYSCCINGKYNEANNIQRTLLPLYDAMRFNPNPVPLKCVMGLLGICGEEVRMPLIECSESTKKNILLALDQIRNLIE